MERDIVFVTVGTDHHPFDRLCAWADAWVKAARHPEIPWFVQSGTSKAPVAAPYRDYIGYDEMCSYMSRAVAVVCHGGPATIMDARRLGRVPIVVPRSADLGEHVAKSQDDVFELVEKAIADPSAFAVSQDGAEIAAAVAKFEELVDGLFSKRRARK
jgi:UDP-N-acetylglucosamine transferase subunit ALG13